MGEALFVLATAVIFAVLGVFAGGWRYRGSSPKFSPVEVVWLREEAERSIVELSPRIMALAEKERVVTRSLYDGRVDEETRVGVEELLAEAMADDFWGRFVTASALVEEELVEAIEELGRLPGLLEETISKLDKAEKLCARRRAV